MAVIIFTPKPGQEVADCPVWQNNRGYKGYGLQPFCEGFQRDICPYKPDDSVEKCWLLRNGHVGVEPVELYF